MTGARSDSFDAEQKRHRLPVVVFVAVPAAMGGSNRSLATVLASMDGVVHRAVAAPAAGSFPEMIAERGLADTFIALPDRARAGRLVRLAAAWRIVRWVFVHRSRVAAIHANALTGLNLAAPASILSRVPVTAWIHDPVGSSWGRVLGPLLRLLLPRLSVAAVSRTAEDVAVANRLCRPGGRIVANPIDQADVVATTRRPAPKVRIGLLGGATDRKGFDLLPSVVAELDDLPLTWMLYVTLTPGTAIETAAALESLAGVDIRIPGKTPDVREAYAECDIVFCPSRAESFCRVAAEAMLNGIPVVASDIEPLRALLGDDEAGFLFPVGDTAAAAAAIRRLAGSPSLRAEMGERGRRRAARYSPEAVTNQLLELYDIRRPPPVTVNRAPS